MKAILTRLTWSKRGISGYNENGFQFRLGEDWMVDLMNRAIVQGLMAIDQEKKRREASHEPEKVMIGGTFATPDDAAAVHGVSEERRAELDALIADGGDA